MEELQVKLRKELEETESELSRVQDLLKERGDYGYGKGCHHPANEYSGHV